MFGIGVLVKSHNFFAFVALQALEPATLIPLQLLKSRGTKCIMVRIVHLHLRMFYQIRSFI